MNRQFACFCLALVLAFWSLEILPQSYAQQPPITKLPGPGENLPVDPGVGQCELDYITEVAVGLKRFCSDDVLGNLMCNIGNVVQSRARTEVKPLCDKYKRDFPNDPVQVPIYGIGVSMGMLCDMLIGLDKERNGVIAKKMYYHGKEYGEIGDKDAFPRALENHILEMKRCYPSITNWPQVYVNDLLDYGKFYCAVKAKIPKNSAVENVMLEAGKRFHSRAKVHSADAVMQRDVVAIIAEHTLCPTGYPNPMQGTSID